MKCPHCGLGYDECRCGQYPDPDPDNDGGGGGGGGSGSGSGGGSVVVPPSNMGPLAKTIFNSSSELTKAQWTKVEKALEKINKDCLGEKLVGASQDKNIKIVYDAENKASGLYNSKTNTITIKNFIEANLSERDFEQVLFHELLHSEQIDDESARMNLEIEAHLAAYRYAVEHELDLDGSKYLGIPLLNESLDGKYKITDQDLFNDAYQGIIDNFKANEFYKKFQESSDDRNLNTLKNLGKDC